MAHWLVKSEPGTYSWSDLVRDGSTEWDGVRNNAARLHLKAMKRGEEALFYHSGDERAIIGVMRVTRGAAPDPTDPDWVSVAVEPLRPLDRPVTLKQVKGDPRLTRMELVRQSRLSVSPVREDEWEAVLELSASPQENSRSRSGW